jgi:hypothetical protein
VCSVRGGFFCGASYLDTVGGCLFFCDCAQNSCSSYAAVAKIKEYFIIKMCLLLVHFGGLRVSGAVLR